MTSASNPADLAAAERVIATADSPPNLLNEFSEEAANRIEQDLLMLTNGVCTRAVVARIRQYKNVLGNPGASGYHRKKLRNESWKDPRKHSQIAIRVACWDNLLHPTEP